MATIDHLNVDAQTALPNTNGGGVKRTHVFALAAALFLSACASQPNSTNVAKRPAALDREAIASVLRAGFGEIREKGLVERSAAELFLAGLKSINQVDPTIQVNAQDGQLIMLHADQASITVKQPSADDMTGWIAASTTLFEHVRQISPFFQVADREAFYQFMFEGALSQIDVYSRYSGGRNARANRAARNGAVGIGIDFDMVPGGAIVRSVNTDGPAQRAGLRIDDMISTADNKSLVGLTRDGARRLFSGSPDSVVKLSVFRQGEDRALVIGVRRNLIVPRMVDYTIDAGVAMIRVHSFNIRTSSDVAQAVSIAKQQTGGNLKGVVLDLRGDPGGLLDQAVDLSDLFLDAGSIVTLSGRHPGAKQYYAARQGDIADGKPLVVIVDGKSASSAEITAAALADNGRAVVVGTNTLGKGSVQTLIRLPNDGEIALTWAEIETPGGYRTHGLGLLPTICTSDYAGSVSSIMEHVYRHEAPWRALPEDWRNAERTDEFTAKLRKLCPAQSRPDNDIDEALAVRIATDRALYAQASSASLAASR